MLLVGGTKNVYVVFVECRVLSSHVVLFIYTIYSIAQLKQDCDMPENLQTPSERPEGGVDDVDVMGFLGLKRADGLTAKKEKKEEEEKGDRKGDDLTP